MHVSVLLNTIAARGWRLLAWLGVAIVSSLSLVPLHVPVQLAFWNSDKLVHVGMYAALMLCFGRGYHRQHWLKIAFLLAGLGLLIELLQGLTPTRQASLLDECANAAGVVIMLWALQRTPAASAAPSEIH